MAHCPPKVFNIKNKVYYTCSFPLLIDLAAHANEAANRAIFEVLNSHGLMDAAAHTVNKTEIEAEIAASTVMPDVIKKMAKRSFAEMDFVALSATVAQDRVKKLRALLGGI